MSKLNHQISQKVFRGMKSRSGKSYIQGKKLAGRMVAGVIEDQILVGFSYVHKKDNYDFVNGIRKPGFGMEMAIGRALKSFEMGSIEVPPSLISDITKFMKRCEVYYKGKDLPELKMQEVTYPQPQPEEGTKI